ncbi:conserved hypothetical protein [Ricinus communis]|uniref:Uncharacterized protein n=1 Tax=Ricinus communis TaxID=3988 RepID=B9TIC1_RICCO|nr:conserved hypothetical protein [Ricinus communis]
MRKDQHEREGEPARHAAVTREHQAPVGVQALGQAALPADALVLEGLVVFRGLGPAHGIGHEFHLVRLAFLAQQAVHADDQFHVLADRVGTVAAGLDHGVLAEHAERAGDDQHAVHGRPAEASEQERAQVFHDLEQRPHVRRQADLREKAARHLAPVGDADRAARRDDGRVAQERFRDLFQAVALQDRVGIDAAHERIARRVDARVQRVGLAAVLLVDHAQVREARGAVDLADLLRPDLAAVGLGERQQAELALQDLERAVLRPVVHDQHFVFGIRQLQHRAHRGRDRRFLVIRGHEDADGRLQAGIDARQVVEHLFLALAVQGAQRQHVQHEVTAVEQDEVAQDEPGDELDEQVVRHQALLSDVRCSAITCARISAAKRSVSAACSASSSAWPSQGSSTMACAAR